MTMIIFLLAVLTALAILKLIKKAARLIRKTWVNYQFDRASKERFKI